MTAVTGVGNGPSAAVPHRGSSRTDRIDRVVSCRLSTAQSGQSLSAKENVSW